MPYKVFISYSTKDSFPAKICSELERLGTECWIAPRDIPRGIPYARAIMKALSEADIVLVFVSSNSLSSEDVLNEIDNAHGMHKTIIPIFIENVELNSEFSYYLKRKQWIKCNGNLKYCIEELSASLNLLKNETEAAILNPPFSMDYFFEKVNKRPTHTTSERFLMPVEDVFFISGRGTVVTGRIESGILNVGDDVWIQGRGATSRAVVTGIEMFRKLLDSAECGDDCGVLLRGVDKRNIERGMVVSKEPLKMYKEFLAAVYLFRKEECENYCDITLNWDSTVEIIHRTNNQNARVINMSPQHLTNGDYGSVKFSIQKEICLENDNIILLRYNNILVGVGLIYGL